MLCICVKRGANRMRMNGPRAPFKADGRKNWCKARGGAFESASRTAVLINHCTRRRRRRHAELVPSINLRRRQMTGSTFCVCTVRKGVQCMRRGATPCVLRLISAFIQICVQSPPWQHSHTPRTPATRSPRQKQ